MSLPFVELMISALRPCRRDVLRHVAPAVLDWHNYADAVKTIPFWRFGRNS